MVCSCERSDWHPLHFLSTFLPPHVRSCPSVCWEGWNIKHPVSSMSVQTRTLGNRETARWHHFLLQSRTRAGDAELNLHTEAPLFISQIRLRPLYPGRKGQKNAPSAFLCLFSLFFCGIRRYPTPHGPSSYTEWTLFLFCSVRGRVCVFTLTVVTSLFCCTDWPTPRVLCKAGAAPVCLFPPYRLDT